MNAIPAIVAGVKNIIMVSPASDGVLNASTIYAAKSLGIKEIYRIGGAQAVAALAYGTETIPKVDKIVGPGNAYVAEAKKQVFGSVGIDMLAGPSEIVVIADSMNDPRIIAADLLSQAEHDVSAQSILITNDKSLAEQVEEEVGMQLKSLTRSEIATKSWSDYGSIIITTSIDESVDISNQIAPEHLELSVQDARSYVEKVNHAGAVFVGTSTPEAIGDYLAGPSHVLPTSRTAKYSSGLSVFDFIKRTSIVECTQESLETIGNDARSIALNEGLDGHARSIEYRLSKK
jgi:histidinol dehydrogenase